MMKIVIIVFVFSGLVFTGCNHTPGKLPMQSVTIGDNKCVVQQMPEEFHEGKRGGHFDYFRIIIESNATISDSGHLNFVNFGMEQAIQKIEGADTLFPAFVQRIANGKKNNYEYMVSFEKETKIKPYQIIIDDQVLGMGRIKFQF